MGKYTKLALTLSVVVFLVIFLIHVVRLFTGFYLQVGSWVVPVWVNAIAALIAAVLVYLNYKAL